MCGVLILVLMVGISPISAVQMDGNSNQSCLTDGDSSKITQLLECIVAISGDVDDLRDVYGSIKKNLKNPFGLAGEVGRLPGIIADLTKNVADAKQLCQEMKNGG